MSNHIYLFLALSLLLIPIGCGDNTKELATLRGHSEDVESVAFSPDGVCLHDCRDDAEGFYVMGLDREVLPVDHYKGSLDVGVGGQWQGRAIKAAASVAVMLKPLMQWIVDNNGDRIKRISVAGFGVDGLPDIEIHTVTGKVIEWGHAAEETNPNEPSQQDKLALLSRLYRKNPDFRYKNKHGRYAEKIKLQWNSQDPVFE